MTTEEPQCPRWLSILPRNPFEADHREIVVYNSARAPAPNVGSETVRDVPSAFDCLRALKAAYLKPGEN